MLNLEDAKERVARGAALLDEHVEGWRKQIVVADLELAHGDYCILGQLYVGGYIEGIGVLFGIWDGALSISEIDRVELHGFAATFVADYAVLQQAWIAILEVQ